VYLRSLPILAFLSDLVRRRDIAPIIVHIRDITLRIHVITHRQVTTIQHPITIPHHPITPRRIIHPARAFHSILAEVHGIGIVIIAAGKHL
jgi:hypothetical protein